MDAFLLGAGRLSCGWKPSALKHISLNKSALDWQIHAFSQEFNIHFLGEYHVEKVIKSYPSLNQLNRYLQAVMGNFAR